MAFVRYSETLFAHEAAAKAEGLGIWQSPSLGRGSCRCAAGSRKAAEHQVRRGGIVTRGAYASRPHFDGGGALEGHDGLLPPPLGTRLADGNASHIVVELGDIHGSQRCKRPALDPRIESDLQGVPLLVDLA